MKSINILKKDKFELLCNPIIDLVFEVLEYYFPLLESFISTFILRDTAYKLIAKLVKPEPPPDHEKVYLNCNCKLYIETSATNHCYHRLRVMFWFELGGDFEGVKNMDKKEIEFDFKRAKKNTHRFQKKSSESPVRHSVCPEICVWFQ